MKKDKRGEDGMPKKTKMTEEIEKIRKNKTRCDWGAWETEEHALACLNYEDCKGCGAWEPTKKTIKRTIEELIKEIQKGKNTIAVLDQYDEGLIFDIAWILLEEKAREEKNNARPPVEAKKQT